MIRNIRPENLIKTLDMKTNIMFRSTEDICNNTQEAMWDIYEKYYSYSKDYFLNRIAKNTHFAFFYEGNKLVGFTGLRINRLNVNGKKTFTIYFGQAAIEKEYRGKNLLRRMSVQIGWKYLWDVLFTNSYCWSDAISYKSYLFYAKSFAEFYPTHKATTPENEKNVITEQENTND